MNEAKEVKAEIRLYRFWTCPYCNNPQAGTSILELSEDECYVCGQKVILKGDIHYVKQP